MTQAVILAGGKGTRLAERLNGRPKPLVNVCGVPLLQRQIEQLSNQGVRDFVILVNHAADQIEAFLSEHHNFGCAIQVINDGEPRGTAGAVLECLDQLHEEFFVIYGDTLFDINLDRMWWAYQSAGADGLLFLHPNDHPQDSDLVEVDPNNWIIAFHPYPHPPGKNLANLVNAAFYILKRDALAPWRSLPGLVDFGKDLFAKMLAAGLRLKGYRSFEYIKDLGTPKRLDKVERHLREGVVARARFDRAQACVFLDRDGTLNELKGYVRDPEELSLITGAGEAVRRLNDLEYRVALVTNQPVIARGEVDAAGLAAIHAKLEAKLGETGAYLDGLYVCPHHPDGGFQGERQELKIICDCRKPAPGLLKAAAIDLNADLSASWMIGDSTSDVAAGQSMGVRTILLATGEGGRDAKCYVPPDFVASDIAQAVDLITNYPCLVDRCRPWLEAVGRGELVLIGGLAKSGKSTLASVIVSELRRNGLAATAISLDRWINPFEARGNGVLGRYDLYKASIFFRPWLSGEELDGLAPFYDRHTRQSIPNANRLTLPADGVLIIEGVPALLGTFDTERTTHQIFIHSAKSSRSDQVLADLKGRDNAPIEASRLYRSRIQDENHLVIGSAARAGHIITFDHIIGRVSL